MDNITEIYSGQIKIKFVEGNHSYWISRKVKSEWTKWERASGATTYGGIKDKSMPLKYWVAKIMSKFLHEILEGRTITKYDIEDAKKLHTKRLEEAATSGSKVHDWIESYCKKQNPIMPAEENVLRGVNAFLEWEKNHKVKILEAEPVVYSRKHDYCGTIDAIATIGSKRYLIDYKTSNGLYNDVMLQTAAYVEAYEEMTGNKIYGRWAIRLEKRSEEEFQADMDEKGTPNIEYQPFEAVYLDHDKNDRKEDFQAYLCAMGLKRWDKVGVKKIADYKTKS